MWVWRLGVVIRSSLFSNVYKGLIGFQQSMSRDLLMPTCFWSTAEHFIFISFCKSNLATVRLCIGSLVKISLRKRNRYIGKCYQKAQSIFLHKKVKNASFHLVLLQIICWTTQCHNLLNSLQFKYTNSWEESGCTLTDRWHMTFLIINVFNFTGPFLWPGPRWLRNCRRSILNRPFRILLTSYSTVFFGIFSVLKHSSGLTLRAEWVSSPHQNASVQNGLDINR